MGLFIIFLGP